LFEKPVADPGTVPFHVSAFAVGLNSAASVTSISMLMITASNRIVLFLCTVFIMDPPVGSKILPHKKCFTLYYTIKIIQNNIYK
jgi:hypothetical protein